MIMKNIKMSRKIYITKLESTLMGGLKSFPANLRSYILLLSRWCKYCLRQEILFGFFAFFFIVDVLIKC